MSKNLPVSQMAHPAPPVAGHSRQGGRRREPAPHRQRLGFGCPQNIPPTGQGWGCPKHSTNWRDLGVSKTFHQLARFGGVQKLTCVEKRPLGPLDPSARQGPCTNWSTLGVSQNRPRALLPKSSTVDWRVVPTARRGPREARPSTAPLQAPGTAGPLDGEVLTNKSSQGRADAQRLVATRLLDRVHDPLGHFSRLQRIYPRAR